MAAIPELNTRAAPAPSSSRSTSAAASWVGFSYRVYSRTVPPSAASENGAG
jgi:hypothetical protein